MLLTLAFIPRLLQSKDRIEVRVVIEIFRHGAGDSHHGTILANGVRRIARCSAGCTCWRVSMRSRPIAFPRGTGEPRSTIPIYRSRSQSNRGRLSTKSNREAVGPGLHRTGSNYASYREGASGELASPEATDSDASDSHNEQCSGGRFRRSRCHAELKGQTGLNHRQRELTSHTHSNTPINFIPWHIISVRTGSCTKRPERTCTNWWRRGFLQSAEGWAELGRFVRRKDLRKGSQSTIGTAHDWRIVERRASSGVAETLFSRG